MKTNLKKISVKELIELRELLWNLEEQLIAFRNVSDYQNLISIQDITEEFNKLDKELLSRPNF